MPEFLPYRRAASEREIRICFLCGQQLRSGDQYVVLTPSKHGAQHHGECPRSVSPTRWRSQPVSVVASR
jgi:hypothetical protein